MIKGVNKNKGILFILFAIIFSILLIETIFAADVAYIYRKQSKVDNNVVNVFENDLGLDVDLIAEKDITKTNFANYRLLYVGDERFSNPNNIPVNNYPSIISNSFYGRNWGLTDFDGVSQLASNNPLSVWVNGTIIQVYTRARFLNRPISIPYYYLDDENKVPAMIGAARTYVGGIDYDFGDVVSYANAGTHLINGKNAAGNICFFGITESDFWTEDAKDLFIDCVGFTGNACSKNSDCGEDEESDPYCINDDVYKNITSFECKNPNTANSMCVEDEDKELVEECEFGCLNGECIEPKECEDDFDNDNDSLIDENDPGCWTNPLNPDSYNPKDDDESNPPIICNEDSDCGEDGFAGNAMCSEDKIFDNFIEYTCLNPGTIVSSCTNTTESKLVSECDDDFEEDPYCEGNNVFTDFHNFSCKDASCSENITKKFVKDCELSGKICWEGECVSGSHDVALINHSDSFNNIRIMDSNGTNILDNPAVLSCNEQYKIFVNVENQGNFYENATINGSIDGLKFSYDPEENLAPGENENKFEFVNINLSEGLYDLIIKAIIPVDDQPSDNNAERQVEVVCPECTSNSQCSDDSYSDNYCSENNVYKDFHDFSCENGQCKENITKQLVEDCPYSCSNGQCVGQCSIDGNCSPDFYSDKYCKDDKVVKDFHDFSCKDASCIENVTTQTLETCQYGCSNGQCNQPNITCDLNSDCGTNGFIGVKYCSNNNSYQDFKSFSCIDAGTPESQCLSDTKKVLLEYCDFACVSGECIDCFGDLDCGKDEFIGKKYCVGNDVYQDYQNAQCLNPTTPQSSCNLDSIPTFIKECPNGCYKGECVNTTCNSHSDCDDNSVYTIDECSHPGTASSYCTNTRVNCVTNADCGINGFTGNEFCSLSDVYKNFRNAACVNPGTRNSFCNVSIVTTKVVECGNDRCEDNSTKFCKNGDVYTSKTCFDSGCSDATCTSITNTTDKLIENCPFGCSNGECVGQCDINSDCKDDFYSDRYCKYDKVVKDFHDFSCKYASCIENVTTEIIEVCPYGCNDGQCVGQCSINEDCSDDFYSDNKCEGKKIVRDFHDFSCEYASCIENVTKQIVQVCPYSCSDGQCVGQCDINSDCSPDSYSNNYCKYDDVYRDFHDFSCHYAQCREEVSTQLVENCSDDFYSDKYCKYDDVYKDFHDFSCENGDCKENITKQLIENCPYSCSNGQCVGQCDINSDCSDDFYSDKYCKYDKVVKDFHDFSCKYASCIENVTTEIIEVCPYGCNNGKCDQPNITCKYNSDCDDDDIYTIDECNNPGTPQSFCTNTRVNCATNADCGVNGFIGNEFCSIDDVYKNYKTSICVNPGTRNSFCNVSIVTTKIVECGNDRCEDNSTKFCKNGDVYTSKTCFDSGCSDAICLLNINSTDKLVEDCPFGCDDGQCVGQCDINSDCSPDSYSNNYCKYDDVYRDFHDFSCHYAQCREEVSTQLVEDCSDDFYSDNYCKYNKVVKDFHDFSCKYASCIENVTTEIIEVCPYGCNNGECIGQCSINEDCSDDFYSDNYCKYDDAYRDFHDFSCKYASCIENVTKQLVEDCKDDFYSDKYCKYDDVYKDFHDFSCENGDCKENITKQLIENCQYSCSNGKCDQPNITCKYNSDCDDDDIYTIDECNNPGTPQSFCTNTRVNCATNADCGVNGFIGNEFCSIDDVYKNYKTSICVNPGTRNSFCNVSIVTTKIVECGNDRCEDNSTKFCKNGDVYTSKTCFDSGCSDAICLLNINSTDKLVEDCPFGCDDGQCVGQCDINSDCSDDFYSDNYCSEDNVYKDFHDFSCKYASCMENVTKQLVEDCKDDFYSDNYCKDGNIARDKHDFSCKNASCMENVTIEIIQQCPNGCKNATCNPPAECKIYAVQDNEVANSQIFTFDPSIQNLQSLGPGYPNKDFEGLDIHPKTGVLYISSANTGELYTANKNTGSITLIGKMGCTDMEALSFREGDNTLWGWCNGKGLYLINPNDASSIHIISSGQKIEGLAWEELPGYEKLYATSGDDLYVIDTITKKFTLLNNNLPGNEDVEALEMLPNGKLLGGMHNQNKGLFIYDLGTGQSTVLDMTTAPFYDIEGIAWPQECEFDF